MAGRLALIACAGGLPLEIARAHPEAMVITLEGVPSALEDRGERHRLEKIGALFDALKTAGVGRVVFAGSVARPALDPAAFDGEMAALAPRLTAAMSQGDDVLLRTVIQVFEAQGFSVVGANAVVPSLVAEAGLAAGPAPDPAEEADIARGAEILRGIAPLDIGQGCVVAGGQCLGVETVHGTDALLAFVAGPGAGYHADHRPAHRGRRGRGRARRAGCRGGARPDPGAGGDAGRGARCGAVPCRPDGLRCASS